MVKLKGKPAITGDPDADILPATTTVDVTAMSAKQKQSLLTLIAQ